MPKAKPVQGTAPKLRFSGFEREWERKNLVEVCDMQAGRFIPASDIYEVERNGLYPCFGGNGLRGYAETYTHDGKFPLIGRQGALCGNVTLADGKFHATEHAVVASPKQDVVVDWLYYTLDRLKLNRFATGQAQPGLSVEVLERVQCWKPLCEAEQQSVADCLSYLDAYIEAEARKLDAIKDHKRGLMQQVFPAEGKRQPCRRFSGFDGDWLEKPLGEICLVLQGYGFPEVMQGKRVGRFPFCKVSDLSKAVIEGGGRLDSAMNYVDDVDLPKLKAKPVPLGTTVFARIGEGLRLNRRAFVERECLIDNNVAGLKSIAGKARDYFVYLLSQLIDLSEHCGGAVPSVNKSTLEAIRVMVPMELAEQDRIVGLMESVDHLISLQASRITVLQQHKKGLMQGLFPLMEVQAQ